MRQYVPSCKTYGLVLGLVCLGTLLLEVAVARAQSANEAVGMIIAPSTHITVAAATLRTPEEIKKAEATLGTSNEYVPFMPTMSPAAHQAAKAAAQVGTPAKTTLASTDPGPLAPPTLRGVSYDGLTQAASGGSFPPDTHGAVGHSHFVEVVNRRITAFNKAQPGAALCTFALQAFFGAPDNPFDPRVLYDQTWRRWVMVATRKSASNTDPIRRFYLAVSRTENPCGPYWVYSSVGFGGGPFNAGDWLDYPGLGMGQDEVLVTGNVFDLPAGGFRFAMMVPIAKASIYNGLGFGGPVFTGLASTLQPPVVLDQNKNIYFLAANNLTHLHLYRGENLSNAFQAILVLQALVDVPDYALPPNAPQPGTAQLLDTLDRRFINNSTQVGDSLWNTHTIRLGRTIYAAPHFYQLDTEGAGANTVKQQGFFYEGGTSHDFNASIAANAAGEAFVTWNSTDVANTNAALRHQARVRFSGRQPVDVLGFISAGFPLFTSPVALTGNPSVAGVQRWGDYSAVSLDPSPGVTVGCGANRRAWIVNEKINAVAVWGSRIGRIGFCD